MEWQNKLDRLCAVISDYGRSIVAFSGGVDSGLVLKVCRDVSGKDGVLAVTAKSPSLSQAELEQALETARILDVHHRVVETREMENPRYAANSERRCFFCKTELYETLSHIAGAEGFKTLCNGANVDDLSDVRPGLEAAQKFQVRSPLIEAECTKDDVRMLSAQLGLKIWDKPASPCLASRIPFGVTVTPEKLQQVEKAEAFLKKLGFRVVRVRHLGMKARVEIGTDEFVRLMNVTLRDEVTAYIRGLGFDAVVYDHYYSGRLAREHQTETGEHAN